MAIDNIARDLKLSLTNNIKEEYLKLIGSVDKEKQIEIKNGIYCELITETYNIKLFDISISTLINILSEVLVIFEMNSSDFEIEYFKTLYMND